MQTLTTPCSVPVTDACYDVGGNRTLDLITPMKDARRVAALLSSVAISVCGNAAGLTDLVMYAWLDINLAKVLHCFFTLQCGKKS